VKTARKNPVITSLIERYLKNHPEKRESDEYYKKLE